MRRHPKTKTMMISQIILLLTLSISAFSFQSQAPSSIRRVHKKFEHLQYVDSEKSHLFSPTLPPTYAEGQRPQPTVTSSKVNRSINNRHSAGDWLYNLKSLPDSSVLKNIRNPVVTMTVWATCFSFFHKCLQWTGYNKLAVALTVSPAAHSFLVSSLGLLLVFRTNSAYQRFQEGRKIWEEILSTSRNLSRMVNLYGREVGNNRKRRILNLLAAFPYLLRHHVRSGCLCKTEAVDERYRLALQEPTAKAVDARYEGDTSSGGAVSPTQLAHGETAPCFVDRREMPWNLLDEGNALWNVARASNRPLWVCDRLGHEITKIGYNDNFTSRERLTMLSSVGKLTDAIGQCERIHQTAVPLNYARHALRSLTLWCLTLPFCMVKDLGLLTGPATGVIAWLLFGVYQIGHSIEDPFQGSLRLSMLCDAIRRDILGEHADVTAFSGERLSAYRSNDLEEEEEEDDDTALLPKLSSGADFAEQVIAHHLIEGQPKIVRKDGAWHVAA